MTTEDPSCADRIDKQMESRENDLEEIYDQIESEDIEVTEEGWTNYHSLPLEIVEYRVVKILLSTGGPADWIEVTLDNDDEIVRMSYHFSDWFDHAEKSVSRNSYIWQYASEVIETI